MVTTEGAIHIQQVTFRDYVFVNKLYKKSCITPISQAVTLDNYLPSVLVSTGPQHYLHYYLLALRATFLQT